MNVMNYIRKNGAQSFEELEENKQDLHPKKEPSGSELEKALKKLINEKRIVFEKDKYFYNLNYQKPKEFLSAIIEPLGREDLSRFNFH